ncbi:MAG: short-chain dehydrogenase [Actinobacteria bacterium]|nr:short-chain dehydrogenase [Dehalococcoidia bacterium]MBD35773.1 short-chain dehydrogenase [Actinomycetota bacterium]MEC7909847.1 SDR family oxidoreductase [Actinomycetota bacterium]|tara:strand:- start:6797 stop:7621 length:825 start_codon:yes stop_codon:yes gene_type:complete
MELKDCVAVVTGGATGIGKALVERFHKEGASGLVVADLNIDGAKEVAESVGGMAVECDVSDESEVLKLISETVEKFGRIDLMVSNAGYVTVGALESPDEDLKKMFDVHVMAHLWAARHAIPHMIEAGGGYLLNTASAAGLLTQLGSLHYSVTKHAAVSLSEFLAITYRENGIKVSVLCPQSVETDILQNSPTRDLFAEDAGNPAAVDGVLTAEEVAQTVVEGLREEKFYILPHPEVSEYSRRKSDDIDRWLAGMHRFQQKLFPAGESPSDWLIS